MKKTYLLSNTIWKSILNLSCQLYPSAKNAHIYRHHPKNNNLSFLDVYSLQIIGTSYVNLFMERIEEPITQTFVELKGNVLLMTSFSFY